MPLHRIRGHSGEAKTLERPRPRSFDQEHFFDLSFGSTILITFSLVISLYELVVNLALYPVFQSHPFFGAFLTPPGHPSNPITLIYLIS